MTEQNQVACLIGIVTYWWIVDFPEKAHLSFHFLNKDEAERAVARIQLDRGDVQPRQFSWLEVLRHFGDWKIYGFAAMFFLLVRSPAPVWKWRSLPFEEYCLHGPGLLSADHVCLEPCEQETHVDKLLLQSSRGNGFLVQSSHSTIISG